MIGAATPDPQFWSGRRVLVTGHTGFKGAWLSTWLTELGASVTGFAAEPDTDPDLFTLAGVAGRVDSLIGDVRDVSSVVEAMDHARPDVVFHLAAQSLVRRSYDDPIGTLATNVMGTAHVLDAARRAEQLRVVVVVTSDKCYENREWWWPYREDDPLGGHDPYSSSKGCAELVTAAWRRSFLADASVAVATARAGNVIGGGDWAPDRLVPDCLRAFGSGEVVRIRRPHSVRPWQHVLDPLSGYLTLAEALSADPVGYAEAWNFGPSSEAARPVEWVVDALCREWGDDATWERDIDPGHHEAGLLQVDASKARARLGWRCHLDIGDAIAWTVAWQRGLCDGHDAAALMLDQITRFSELGRGRS